MSTVTDRVMARLAPGPPEVSDELILAYRELSGYPPPDDLVAHWRRWGSGDGHAGPGDSGQYLRLHSLADALDAFEGYEGSVPDGMALIGDDGGPSMVVHADGRGYGLIGYLNSGPADLTLVADTLEGFLAACEAGSL
ncbi:MAG: SMI1/KNR4 family protein [Rhodobacteraceae bacterium]|jgi:hypothetical protein|nr:SMI1/KNR4 family protein [Paracoccaceae bacterium]